MDILSDSEIANLLTEEKPLPDNYRKKTLLKQKTGHKEAELAIKGVNGNDFRLIIRQSLSNPLDLSVIPGFLPPCSNQLFRLRRYNGKSHEHTNFIENATFYDFHIHYATKRYQEIGVREDAYAEVSDSFSDLNSAYLCMI